MHLNHHLSLPILLCACSLATAISPPAPPGHPKGPLHAKLLEVVGQQGYSQTPELQLMFLTEVGGKIIFSELGGEIPLEESIESRPYGRHTTKVKAEAGAEIPSGLPTDSSVYYYGTFDMLETQIGLDIFPEGNSKLELAVMNYQNLEKLKVLIREPSM